MEGMARWVTKNYMKSVAQTSSFEVKPTHGLRSHIFYNILKYSKHILEIEATVYKTFPAEILDGPASAFFPRADRSIFA